MCICVIILVLGVFVFQEDEFHWLLDKEVHSILGQIQDLLKVRDKIFSYFEPDFI